MRAVTVGEEKELASNALFYDYRKGAQVWPGTKEAYTRILIAFIGVWVLHMHFNHWRTNNGRDTARCISGANGIRRLKMKGVVYVLRSIVIYYSSLLFSLFSSSP